jgi:hypothetical protein
MFEADLMNTCCRQILTTQEEVSSVKSKQTCRWIFNFKTTTPKKDIFSRAIFGPFQVQLTIEGKIIEANFLKPIEIMN